MSSDTDELRYLADWHHRMRITDGPTSLNQRSVRALSAAADELDSLREQLATAQADKLQYQRAALSLDAALRRVQDVAHEIGLTASLSAQRHACMIMAARGECPEGPHRGPEGPNEDVSQCHRCGSVSHALRPAGETFGHHLPDCSLPIDHESFCVGGGEGHPEAETIRG